MYHLLFLYVPYPSFVLHLICKACQNKADLSLLSALQWHFPRVFLKWGRKATLTDCRRDKRQAKWLRTVLPVFSWSLSETKALGFVSFISRTKQTQESSYNCPALNSCPNELETQYGPSRQNKRLTRRTRCGEERAREICRQVNTGLVSGWTFDNGVTLRTSLSVSASGSSLVKRHFCDASEGGF